MNDVRKEELIRLSMKRELTPEEQSQLEDYFAQEPQARACWEEERALSSALQSLPDVPLSSNFTARVLQAIDLDEADAKRRAAKPWFRVSWPRLGWITAAGAVVLGAVLGVQHAMKPTLLAQDFVRVARDLNQLPEPEVLQNFEVVSHLPASSDDELLIALQ